MQKPKVLLFDLGGVIVRWVGLDALAEITGLPREIVIDRFAASEIFSAYETGRCGDDVFAQELITQFGLAISLPAAKDLWNSWVQESYAGTKSMLVSLRKDYTIACLSNTNALHWGHLPSHINIDDYFDHSYASHLINSAKPDPVSYQIPVQEMGFNPHDVWFFDDTMINVEAAKAAGLEAFHVDREVGVIPTLKELGLLP
ncbi:MAG: HAD-IA family hydrolase [Hellea sp.]